MASFIDSVKTYFRGKTEKNLTDLSDAEMAEVFPELMGEIAKGTEANANDLQASTKRIDELSSTIEALEEKLQVSNETLAKIVGRIDSQASELESLKSSIAEQSGAIAEVLGDTKPEGSSNPMKSLSDLEEAIDEISGMSFTLSHETKSK